MAFVDEVEGDAVGFDSGNPAIDKTVSAYNAFRGQLRKLERTMATFAPSIAQPPMRPVAERIATNAGELDEGTLAGDEEDDLMEENGDSVAVVTDASESIVKHPADAASSDADDSSESSDDGSQRVVGERNVPPILYYFASAFIRVRIYAYP